MSILDVNMMLSGASEPEPTLREMVTLYYAYHARSGLITEEEAADWSEEYLRVIQELINRQRMR